MSVHYELFDEWSDAFDTCRERNRPITVKVGEEPVEVIFPSGMSRRVVSADGVFECEKDWTKPPA